RRLWNTASSPSPRRRSTRGVPAAHGIGQPGRSSAPFHSLYGFNAFATPPSAQTSSSAPDLEVRLRFRAAPGPRLQFLLHDVVAEDESQFGHRARLVLVVAQQPESVA